MIPEIIVNDQAFPDGLQLSCLAETKILIDNHKDRPPRTIANTEIASLEIFAEDLDPPMVKNVIHIAKIAELTDIRYPSEWFIDTSEHSLLIFIDKQIVIVTTDRTAKPPIIIGKDIVIYI